MNAIFSRSSKPISQSRTRRPAFGSLSNRKECIMISPLIVPSRSRPARRLSILAAPWLLAFLFFAGLGPADWTAAAFADSGRYFNRHQERERSYAFPRSYEERRPDYDFGHRHHHHAHDRHCREHLVPYWDPYWRTWSHRFERVCW